MSAQGEMDFGVYATAACNDARRRNMPPVPDQAGFFDSDGVIEICGRRQCNAEFSGEFAATVQFTETKVPLTAIAPGRWDAVSILSACTKAHRSRVVLVKAHKVRPKNPGGLDELKIARIVAADGVVPYRSRGLVHAGIKAADPTYAFENILAVRQILIDEVVAEHRNTSNYSVRRGLRALEDVGLVKIKLGPRGGMATATFSWTTLAYLPKTAPHQVATNHDDDLALEALAAGLA